MSTWDEKKLGLDKLSPHRGLIDGGFPYSYFFPTDGRRLCRLLTTDERENWTFADLHDLARFVEDFVLCDHVGVAADTLDRVGPYLIEYFPDIEQFPLFNSTRQLLDAVLACAGDQGRLFNGDFARTAGLGNSDQDVTMQRLRSRFENERQESHARVHEYRSRRLQLQSALAGLGIPKSGCDAGDEVSPIRQKQLDTIETLSQLEALEGTRQGWYETFLGAEDHIGEMKQELLGLMEAMQVSQGLTGGLGPRDGTRTFYAALASWSRRYGLVVSPGFGMLEFFNEGNGPGAIAQRIYSEVSVAHKELLAKVEKWTRPRSYSVPPLLSIIVSEARSRADFPRVLVQLRQRFSGLRQDMRKLSAQLNAETSWQQKLNVVAEIESVRDVVLKKASRAHRQSIVRRTWDIVKKKSAWEALTSLADLALDWDEKRQLVVGIRHFIDLERLALEVRAEERQVRRLFGEIHG